MSAARRVSSWGWLVLAIGVLLAGFVATGGGVGGTASDDGSQLWVPASRDGSDLDGVLRVNGVSGVLESGVVDTTGCRLFVGESGIGVVLTSDGPVRSTACPWRHPTRSRELPKGGTGVRREPRSSSAMAWDGWSPAMVW